MMILAILGIFHHAIINQFAFFDAYCIPINGLEKNSKRKAKASLYRNHLNKSGAAQTYFESVCCNVCAVYMVDHMMQLLHAKNCDFVCWTTVRQSGYHLPMMLWTILQPCTNRCILGA